MGYISPGCLSLLGLYMELGPCRISDASGTRYHPKSWTENTNILCWSTDRCWIQLCGLWGECGTCLLRYTISFHHQFQISSLQLFWYSLTLLEPPQLPLTQVSTCSPQLTCSSNVSPLLLVFSSRFRCDLKNDKIRKYCMLTFLWEFTTAVRSGQKCWRTCSIIDFFLIASKPLSMFFGFGFTHVDLFIIHYCVNSIHTPASHG